MITTIIILGVFVYLLRHLIKPETLVEMALIGFILITLVSETVIVSGLYEKKTTTESNTESTEIYALKDSSSKQIHAKAYKGIFVAYGIADVSTSNSTYKYCSEATVGDRRVKTICTLKVPSQEVFFDDTLKDGEQSRLDVVTTTKTTKTVMKHPEKKILYAFFLPGSVYTDIFSSLKTQTQTETQYIFVIPEGSMTDDVAIDMD